MVLFLSMCLSLYLTCQCLSLVKPCLLWLNVSTLMKYLKGCSVAVFRKEPHWVTLSPVELSSLAVLNSSDSIWIWLKTAIVTLPSSPKNRVIWLVILCPHFMQGQCLENRKSVNIVWLDCGGLLIILFVAIIIIKGKYGMRESLSRTAAAMANL